MPQPMSTPTADGITAFFVGITEPTVAPIPTCASGMRATCPSTIGRRAVFSAWRIVSGSMSVAHEMSLSLMWLGMSPPLRDRCRADDDSRFAIECQLRLRDREGMQFVPYEELAGTPNVIVDGSGGADTVLTLSHWPGSRTTESLRADLSAEIVIRYLQQPALHVDVDAVSNNHFDEDGLMGMFALVDRTTALAQKELLIDVARAGDFGWSHARDEARISFAISTLVDPEVSQLDRPLFQGEYPQ